MGASIRFSMTVKCPNRLKDWKTMPILRLASVRSYFGAVISTPSSRICPPVGRSSMLMQRISVDFPVPEGPITEITSPSFITAFTSFRGVAFSYCFLRCLSSIIGFHPLEELLA